MPLPDKHAEEGTVEVPESLWVQYRTYREKEAGWRKLAEEIQKSFITEMQAAGASAIKVDGLKVAAYRPKSNYATSQLQKDYPELTQHYKHEVSSEQFDIELFAKAHPEVAEQYRIRSFTEL